MSFELCFGVKLWFLLARLERLACLQGHAQVHEQSHPIHRKQQKLVHKNVDEGPC